MSIEVTLAVESAQETLWTALRRCPAIDLARPGARGAVEVTALVLEQSVYGRAYPLTLADAVFLTSLPTGRRVLVPGDVVGGDGERYAGFAGQLRVPVLAWLAKTAQRAWGLVRVTYWHERGDWPYEFAEWTFGRYEALRLAAFDGGARPRWRGHATLRPRRRPPARPLAHRPFASLLRDWGARSSP